MQRLKKFAASPNINRRLVSDSSDPLSPPGDMSDKLNALSLASPQDLDLIPPNSATSSSCESSLISPPEISPLSPLQSPPCASTTTPARNRRMAFFNTKGYSLDESVSASKFGSCGAQTQPRRTGVQLSASPIRLLHPRTGSGSSGSAVSPDFGDLEYMNTSNEGYRLTLEQRELVKEAWRNANVDKQKSTAGTWIFKRIFAHYPYLKRLFNLHQLEDEHLLDADPQFQKHAQVFTDVLEMIVECIDALDDCLGPLLISYGSKHVRFESGQGFKPEYWDAFAVAMIEYASNNWKFHKNAHKKAEALRAWRVLVCFVVSKVKQGFMLEKKALESDQ